MEHKNTSLTSPTNLMRGIYKRRALAPRPAIFSKSLVNIRQEWKKLFCRKLNVSYYFSILFFFWTLSAVSGTFTFRSVIRSGHLSGESKVLPLITACIQYPIVVAAFFLSCWSDPKPRYVDIEGMYVVLYWLYWP